MRRRIVLTIGAAAISLMVATPGQTVGQAALPGAEVAATYALPAMVVPQGQTATFANLDPLAPHDVTSVRRVGGATSPRLFQSATIDFGETADIARVSSLPVGEYEFFCLVHPTMEGVLHVV